MGAWNIEGERLSRPVNDGEWWQDLSWMNGDRCHGSASKHQDGHDGNNKKLRQIFMENLIENDGYDKLQF